MSNPINTLPVQQFIQQVKAADLLSQKEIKIDIKTAKLLALCMGEVCAKLVTDYELLIKQLQTAAPTEPVTIQVVGGTF
jgi:hypothetical protein